MNKDDVMISVPLTVKMTGASRSFLLKYVEKKEEKFVDLTSHLSQEILDSVEQDLEDGDVIDLDLSVSVDATYRKGTSDYFDKGFGNWLPGDPEECEIESVKLGDFEIGDFLPDDAISRIDEIMCEEGRNQEDYCEPDYDEF